MISKAIPLIKKGVLYENPIILEKAPIKTELIPIHKKFQ